MVALDTSDSYNTVSTLCHSISHQELQFFDFAPHSIACRKGHHALTRPQYCWAIWGGFIPCLLYFGHDMLFTDTFSLFFPVDFFDVIFS